MAGDGLKAFLQEHAEELIRHAVAVAREDLSLSDSETPARLERELRQVYQRLLPEEAEGRPRLALLPYLRASVALREGLARLLREPGRPQGYGEAVERDVARLLGSRILKATALEAERREGEARDVPVSDPDGARAQRTIDHLTKLFEASPDGIVTLDEEGLVMSLNKAARSITGYRASEIVGVQFSTLLADAKGARNLFKRLKKKWVSNYETLLRDKEGHEVPISLSASVLEAGEDDGPKMVFIVRDLSEVQEMKAQLIESEKLAAMAKIAGSVAHEIRNPLNSLFLNTDLLEDEIRQDGRRAITPRAEHLLSVVREEIDRLNNIIVNYLSLAKVSALSPVPTDVNEFLASAVREKKPEAEEARVTIVERFQQGLPVVLLDEGQMRRVVFNVIQNAINAMPDGGTFTIITRTGKRDTVDIEMADTGVGIAPEHMPSVFHPFFSRLGGGTGLGLYLSREIVVNHQGKVSVKSDAGVGTTVTITLPVQDDWEER